MASQGILKPVETHVRIMSHASNCTLTSNTMAIPLPGEMADPKTFHVSRVHKPPQTNQEFYTDVIRPAVTSCLAGQSYTIMFVGPASSGRSHNIYGSASELGMVHLVAADLLKEKDCTAHVSGFKCNGEKIVETVHGTDNVYRRELPAPFGKVALPPAKLLTQIHDAAIIPGHRSSTDSCFIQFHIYRKLEAHTLRSAFATLTLIDTAAFQHPVLPSDVSILSNCIERVNQGVDPQFDRCMLTCMLENALIGSTSLITVATVTGRSETSRETTATLKFVELAGKVNQVGSIVHIQPPAQFPEWIRAWDEVKGRMHEGVRQAHEAGCSAVARLISNQLTQTMASAPKALEASDKLVNEAREHIANQLKQVEQAQGGQFDVLEEETAALLNKAQEHREKSQRFLKMVREQKTQGDIYEEEIQQIEGDIEQTNIMSEMKLAQMDTVIGQGKRDRDRYAERRAQLRTERETYDQRNSIHDEQLAFEAVHWQHSSEMASLGKKRVRLEAALSDASENAATTNTSQRMTRERKSRMSIITNMEMQVQQLRSKHGVHYNPSPSAVPTPTTAPPPQSKSRQPAISRAGSKTPPKPNRSEFTKSPTPNTTMIANGIVVSPAKRPLGQQSSNRALGNRSQAHSRCNPSMSPTSSPVAASKSVSRPQSRFF